MKKVRVLFIGTSEFGVPSLRQLIESDIFEVVGVVTQPDKPQGRHHSKFIPSPVKQFLIDSSSKVQLFQPEKLKQDAENILEQTSPDIIIVASYGQMVPNVMLKEPKFGAVNVHASLLPDLRGAVPMPMAILYGYKDTGVTIQKMVSGLDEGPILAQKTIEIDVHDTTETLEGKLSKQGADLLVDTLNKWVRGEIKPQEQNNDKATYCYQQDISKDKAEIKFNTPIEQAERMIRAFYPWPIAWVQIPVQGNLKRLRIFGSEVTNLQHNKNHMQIFREGKNLYLSLKDGSLLLKEIQLEGKQRMSAKDYLFLAEES